MYYANRRLNSKYFQFLTEKSTDFYRYEAYRPVDRPMILFSLVDGSPLASLTFRAQDGNSGKCVMSKRPSRVDPNSMKCDFQGLIDTDDQEFELVITNLNTSGFINFNILKKEENIETVNPGGLNEINELRPNESYAVKCDQATNLSLILTTMKKKLETGEVREVSVEEDEAEAREKKEKPKGTYYYLNVVPQMGQEDLVKRFERTQWACVDVFYRQIRDESGRKIRERRNVGEDYRGHWNQTLGGQSRDRGERGFARMEIDEGEEELSFDLFDGAARDHHISDHNVLVPGHHYGINTVGQSLKNANRQIRGDPPVSRMNISPWRQSSLDADTNRRAFSIDDDEEPETTLLEENPLRRNARSRGSEKKGMPRGDRSNFFERRVGGVYDQSETARTTVRETTENNRHMGYLRGPMGAIGVTGSVGGQGPQGAQGPQELPSNFTPVGPVPRQPAAFEADRDRQIGEDLIMKSSAAQVRGGRRVEVNSVETGIEYAYDKMSNQCVIGLSVAPGLTFRSEPSRSELTDLVMQLIESQIRTETSQLIEMLQRKYVEEDCCICLESQPDLIFYQCGHQCTHRDCAKGLKNGKCPLCRSYISAEIPVA